MKETENMHRMQFYIPLNLREDLMALAEHRDVSMGELIREAIQSYVSREGSKRASDPALDLIGMIGGSDYPDDMAVNHDKYIYRKDWEE